MIQTFETKHEDLVYLVRLYLSSAKLNLVSNHLNRFNSFWKH